MGRLTLCQAFLERVSKRVVGAGNLRVIKHKFERRHQATPGGPCSSAASLAQSESAAVCRLRLTYWEPVVARR